MVAFVFVCRPSGILPGVLDGDRADRLRSAHGHLTPGKMPEGRVATRAKTQLQLSITNAPHMKVRFDISYRRSR